MGRAKPIRWGEASPLLNLLTPENRLVCRLMISTGLRVSDALALTKERLAQAERGRGYVTLRESKTGKNRRVYIDKALREALRQQAKEWGRSPYVFPGRLDPEKHRSRQAVWKDLERAGKALRYRGQISPHSMRKVAALEKARATGGDIEAVSRWLAHGDPAVTAIYLLADFAERGDDKPRRKRA